MKRYPSPNRPMSIKAINRIGQALNTLGIHRPALKVTSLLNAAQRNTGLEDFGNPQFRDGLERIVEGLNGEARLSQIGRFSAHASLLQNLSLRLQLIEYRKTRAEVSQQTVSRPLFILGLPRTGTTILHELLAQDPAHRTPASWETERPLPPAQAQTHESDPRIAEIDQQFAQLEQLAPELKSIHAMGAALPQECLSLLAPAFASELYSTSYHMPSYRRWLLDHSLSHAYEWHHAMLQHLQVDFRAERWVLKAPVHLPYLTTIVQQYPDAAFVWTHRDPMEVIGSVSSLVCTLRSAFSDHIDPMATGQEEAQYFSDVIQMGLEQRQAMQDEQARFFDLGFKDLLTNPLEAIASMYAHFGFELSEEARTRMADYLAQRPRDKHGVHRYTLDDFGLSQTQHKPLFTAYRERFEPWLTESVAV